MLAGYEGNRHARLPGFGQHSHLLIQCVAPAALDAGQNLDSINTITHRRTTRFMPSSYFNALCPVQLGAAPAPLKPSDTPMPNSVDRVEVFTGIQRRRRYTLEQKLAAVAEASQPGMSISFVARRHGISPSLLFGWRRRMAEGGKEAVRVDDEVVASAEVKALEKRIRELERVLGKKTLENEILREAVKVAHEKN